jgi:hypothetical protein
MADIWTGSAPARTESGSRSLASGRPKQGTSPLLALWWAAWIVSMITGQASFRMSLRADEVDELVRSAWVGLVDNLAGLVSAGLTVLIVRAVQARHDARYLAGLEEARGAEAAGPAGAAR